MTVPFTLAERPNRIKRGPKSIDRSAPLPCGYGDALEHARHLRLRGMAWPAIAVVMSHYHGWHYSDGWWSVRLRDRVPAAKPRGVPFTATNNRRWQKAAA